MQWALIAFIVGTGILNVLQSGVNSTLQKASGHPFWSLVAISAVSFATSLVILAISGERTPSVGDITTVPWWGWIGGAFGTIYVLSLILAANKVGAGVLIGVTVTVGIVTSILLDHYGLVGFDVHKAGVGRIAGAILMILGVGFVAAF